MSGQQIGTVVGGFIGAYFGVPQLGMAIGGFIGGAIDPTKINGPHLGDGQQQTATDGAPIAWVMGTATIAGTIIAVGPRREVKIKDSGKGGPVVSHYESRQDFAILVCESSELKDSTIQSIVMVEQDGKIVYDIRQGSTILSASAKWKANVDFMFGGEDQMPHPTLESIFGVGKTPAYRGRCVAVFKDFNIYNSGDRIPTFRFTVSTGSETSATILENDDLVLTGTPQWDHEDQSHVVGGYRDFPITSDLSQQILLKSINNWAVYRVVLVPYYSEDIPDESVGLSTEDVVSHLGVTGVYDTGWRKSSGPDPDWDSWWTDNGLAVPEITSGGDLSDIGFMINSPEGHRVTGIRVYTFYRFGGFDAVPTFPTFSIAQTPGEDLSYIGNGMFVGTSGDRYKYSWADVNVPGVPTLDPIPLSDIMSRIAKRGGLTTGDIDVTDLSSADILGYPIARQATAADCMLPVLQAYFAYATQYDLKLHFHFYGQDAAVTVDRDDLIEGNDANNGAITEQKRNQATEFPRRIVGSYMDPDQNYMVVDVPAERTSSTVIAIGEQKLDIPVVMPANDAARAVQKAMKVAYAALEGTRDYCTPWARGDSVYLTVCAGEPILMDNKRWVANEIDLSSGYMKFSTRYDRQSAYTSNVQAVTGNAPTPPTSPYSGPTILVPMNLPSLRPQDTYGVYLAAKGESSSWRGCNVQVSYDGQASWQNAVTITLPSVIGTLEDDVPSDDEPLIVDVGDDLLESVTDDQITANANAFALIDADDHAEVWQFKTAELQSDGTYELTDTSRGLAGSTAGDPSSGSDFVMLDAVHFLPIDISFKGRTVYFRAVGFGEVAEDQPIVSLVYEPDTTVIHDGGTVTP